MYRTIQSLQEKAAATTTLLATVENEKKSKMRRYSSERNHSLIPVIETVVSVISEISEQYGEIAKKDYFPERFRFVDLLLRERVSNLILRIFSPTAPAAATREFVTRQTFHCESARGNARVCRLPLVDQLVQFHGAYMRAQFIRSD